MIEKEIWLDIKDFSNYEVSSFGNIRNKLTNEYLKQYGKYYKQVIINNCHLYVHRLVAIAFLENKHNYTEINHIDENSLNNNVNNLEWCTPKYNSNYGHHRENISKALKGKKKPYLSERNKNNYYGCKSKEEYLLKHNNIPAVSPMKGKHHSEETKRKISETFRRKREEKLKEVIRP